MSRTVLLPAVLLALVSTPALARGDLVVPDVAVQVVDFEGGQPLGNVSVELLARSKKDDGFDTLASATTGADGWARFASRPYSDLDFMGVRVSWSDRDRPQRSLVGQIKAKKGDKTGDGFNNVWHVAR